MDERVRIGDWAWGIVRAVAPVVVVVAMVASPAVTIV
jgi:hypothetical protein